MTIYEAQEQKMTRVRVYVHEPVFAHGQLFVALSRSGYPRETRIYTRHINKIQGHFDGYSGSFTNNIVSL